MKGSRILGLVLVAGALVFAMAGVAMADSHGFNSEMARGTWYYPWVGPQHQEFGMPDKGAKWQKDWEGEVKYIDSEYLVLEAEGSGDMMHIALYPGVTRFTPSWDGVRVGSKVKVRTDDRHRARWIHVVPYHVWLAGQSK